MGNKKLEILARVGEADWGVAFDGHFGGSGGEASPSGCKSSSNCGGGEVGNGGGTSSLLLPLTPFNIDTSSLNDITNEKSAL